ncbi:MAG: hypothetical protein VW715_07320 [Rhodospirillales bacterium]
MLLEVTNLNIGEKIIIDTNDWDFEDINLRPTQSDDYLIIYYNNWEYQVHADDFEAFVAEKLSLAKAIEC